MAGSFQSIFKRKSKQIISPPESQKPLMRVLEPRVLLDAAVIETALDIAGQAAHSQLADDYQSNTRIVENITEHQSPDENPQERESSLVGEKYADDRELDGSSSRRTDGEIVFIDAGVEDKEALIASLEPGVTIHILDAGSDGVQQIADILADSGGFDAVHIFSHGVAGSLQLGSTQLDSASIQGRHAEALRTIGSALSENGDILIYGCDFGKGELGRLAAGQLAAATGADIAASDDLTGSESLSGDWDLELQTGTIERQAFTAPDWNGILDGYKLAATGAPTIGHLDGGIVGTSGTTALWSGAVEYDPGGGAPLEYFDIQATLIGVSGSTSATFESVASDSATIDDFRIVLTNIGPVEQTINGEDVLSLGAAAIRWSILIPGTQNFAPADKVNIVMRDIDGLGGLPDTRDTISIEPQNISSYTVETTNDLQLSADQANFRISGTKLGVNEAGSQIGVSWESVNNFVVVYESRSLVANFDMLGDAGLSTFVSPETIQSQSLDLNGSDGAGTDYLAVYVNGTTAGSPEDVPLSIADLDVSIFDLDNDKLFSSTIHMTNVLPGDNLNYDEVLLNKLGLFVTFTQVPDVPATATEYILQLDGNVLISNYLTAIQSITYSNSNIDAFFDQVTPRIIEVSITDGLQTSQSTTTILIGNAGNAPVAGNNIYVEDEDVPIIASAANGLLADDRDKNGDDLDITSVTDSNGVALVDNGLGFLVNPTDGGGQSLLTNGATVSINKEDGSFTYTPAAYYSGNETFAYIVTDGTNNTQGFATFDIQPIANDVVFSINAPDPNTDPGTDEDQPSVIISVDALSPDSSETQEFVATGIPVGVILTDGTLSFTATQSQDTVTITNWDRTQLRVLPVQNSDEEILVVFLVRNFEIDGSLSEESQAVTFKINAVADTPELIVIGQQAGIDEEVDLSEAIQPRLFDEDGSEQLTDITISNIPAGGVILVNNVAVPIIGGTVVLSEVDLETLVFRPPVIGFDIIYNLLVTATSTESNPAGTVTTLTATTAQTVLTIDLNNNDQPVVAVDDAAVAFAGETVVINVLANDFIPDGSPQITLVNGLPIDVFTPIILVGGEGIVTLSPFGRLVFEASSSFAGEVSFTYTVQDVDQSEDTANVTVKVQPRWVISSLPNAVEGGNARFNIAIDGAVKQGGIISTDVVLLDNTATSADHATLLDAITSSIDAFGQNDFSFDGVTLTYTAPDVNYTSTYDATGSTYIDISSTGEVLSLGNDSVAQRNFGFDFDFYGDSFSSIFISANGYLTFGSPGVVPENETLDGGALSGRPIIAPFWDDLNTQGGAVHVERLGSVAGEYQYIIQWSGVTNATDGAGTASFQVVLSEATGEIRFNFQDVTFDGVGDDGAGATVGLQSATGVADEFSHNTPGGVISGSSIVFTRGVTLSPTLLIDVAIVDDAEFELNETFSINLANPVDSAIGTNTALVSIDISDNAAPVTADDSAGTQETGIVSFNILDPDIGASGEAGEDSDIEGHSFVVSQINGNAVTGATTIILPSGATVDVELDGQLTYNPNGAFAYLAEGELGTDTFTYHARDFLGEESVAPATVTITIVGENQAPAIDLNDDGTSLSREFVASYLPTETQINVASPNASILDPDNTSFIVLHISLGGFVQAGNEMLHVGGVVIGYQSAATTHVVTLGATTYDVVYDGSNSINITNNAGGELTALEINAFVRALQYENDSNDDTPGLRTMTFSADDINDLGQLSISSINVIGNNDAPVAVDDAVGTPYVTAEDTSVLIALSDLTVNDFDVDIGDSFTVVSVQGGANGSAVLDGNGNVIYTPAGDYTGSTFFTYTIEDTVGVQDTASVFVDVTPVNDAPRIDLNGLAFGTDYTFVYVENDAPTSIIAFNGTVIDVDNPTITELVITMTNGQLGDLLEVGGLPAGISASMVPVVPVTGLTAPSTIVVTLTGIATPADYEIALRAVSFSNTTDIPSEINRIVSVTASDGALDSVVVTTTIQVLAVNDAPDTNADGVFLLQEDGSINFTSAALLANDSDAESDPLVITSVQGATAGGTVTIDGGGNITYTAAPNYFGNASFTYTAEDGNGGVTTETVNLLVQSVNDLAVIDLDTGSAGTGYATSYLENAAPIALVDASFSISDVDDVQLDSAQIILTNGFAGDVLDVTALSNGVTMSIVPAMPLASNGLVTLTLSGTASLSVYENIIRSATFFINSDAPSVVSRNITIFVNDGDDNSNVGVTTIDVTAVNDVPIANDDNSIVVDEDVPRIITAAELLSNDIDPDLDVLTIFSVQSATNGSAVLNGNGSVTFTPVANYFGPASFTYTIDDGNGEQATASVNLTVNSVNDAPLIDLNGGSSGTSYATTFTENGSPVQVVDASITIGDIDSPSISSATITLNNGQVGDTLVVSGLPAGVSVGITPASNLIVAGTITVEFTGITDFATYQLAMQAIRFTSNSENPDTTTRSLTITVNDGEDNSLAATTSITVIAVNDAPVAGADGVFSFDEDTLFAVPASTLLANDSDAEGDAIAVVSVQGAVNGTVVLGGDNVIRFTPNAAYFGPASFTYTIRDSNGAEDTQTVSLNVIFLNDAPILDLDGTNAGSGFVTNYTENGVGISIVDGTANIFDEDHVLLLGASIQLTNGRAGDILEIGILPGGMSATVVPGTGLSSDGVITINLSGNVSLADFEAALAAITYRSTSENPNTTDRLIDISVTDGLDASNVATTRITVNGVNDAPVAVDDGVPTPLSVLEDSSIVFNPVSSNDFDVDFDVLTITQIDGNAIAVGIPVTLVGGGTVALSPDGVSLTFTPPPNYFGPVAFDYTISDGSLIANATVHLNVISVNDVPVALDDGPVVLLEDTFAIFDPVSPNDSDVEGDPLNIVSINGQAITANASVIINDGVVTLGADGRTITFVPSANFFGQSVVNYGLSDGQDTSFANVTFDVTPVDDVITIISMPPNLTLNDSETVQLPMGGFIYDPDGDALVYTATGLPAGLVLDQATGVISGTLASSASQSGPYSITLNVNDGVSSAAILNFDIEVLNVIPVASSDVTVEMNDGENFTINSAPLFTDADGDALSFTATGLPSWASISATSGVIIGTVPSDASVFGPVVVSVTVADGDGGTASTDITLDPRNLAPIAVSTINDMSVQEEDDINLDLGGLFADGGADNDVLVLSVNGLPEGITFDPANNRIIGEFSTGSGSITPYIITITADDGQGGTVSVSFSLRVARDTFLPENEVVEDETVSIIDPLTGVFDPVAGQIDVTNLVSGISDLNSTSSLDAKSGVLLNAVSAIDPLYEITSVGSNDDIPNQILALGEMPAPTDWLNASGREGNGDWNVSGTFGYMSLSEEKTERDILGKDERLERISLEINSRQGVLYIEFKNELVADRDGQVVKTTLLLPDGKPLPEWMKLIREGFISAKPPVGETEIVIEMVVVLGNGHELTKTMLVDFKSGDAVAIEKPHIDEIAEKIKEYEKTKLEFEMKDLRGSVSPETPSV